MILEAKDIFLYSNSENSLNFSLTDSSYILLESSSGKTSLFNALTCQAPPHRGEVLLNGTPLFTSADYMNSLPAQRAGRDLGVIFSKHALISNLSLYENIELILVHKRSDLEDEKRDEIVKTHLESAGLIKFSEKRPCELSSNQLKLASFIRATIYGPSLLIWDDPFYPDDEVAANYIKERLNNIFQQRSLVIAIGSCEDIAKKLAIPIYSMNPKRLSA